MPAFRRKLGSTESVAGFETVSIEVVIIVRSMQVGRGFDPAGDCKLRIFVISHIHIPLMIVWPLFPLLLTFALHKSWTYATPDPACFELPTGTALCH